MSEADNRGHQAMVHAGGRRLNPPQPAPPYHLGPIDGHLGVSAENIRSQDFAGDALLPGIDEFGIGRGGGDLRQVTLLDRVAEDNPHSGFRQGVSTDDNRRAAGTAIVACNWQVGN